MEKTSTFAARLREALDSSGMSQSRLAELVGCDRSMITQYLQGKYEAKQEYLNRLAVALNVSEAWLMGLNVEKTRKTRESTMTPEESELVKMYGLLDGDGRARLLAYAVQLIDARKGKIDE